MSQRHNADKTRMCADIVESMAEASKTAGGPVARGGTKVVERGKGDGVVV